MNDYGRPYDIFEQDSAKAHTADNSVRCLESVLAQNSKYCIVFPSSTDLNPCDRLLYFWGACNRLICKKMSRINTSQFQ